MGNFTHKEQLRKSTDIAYISHPFGVASLVIEAGGDEDQAIAGLLHDVAEDCGGEPKLAEIAQFFGDRVAHIEHLRSSNADVLLVTAADKTHNARSISTDIQSIGIMEKSGG